MKKACFIANYYKTEVFCKIAQRLEETETKIYWIVPNKDQYKDLSRKFPPNQILYIGKKEILKSEAPKVEGNLKINELVFGDRVLREESSNWAYNYLHKLGNVYMQFIKQNQIDYIFSELTWAHELLACRLVSLNPGLKCQFLNPHTVRIPNGRFAFFLDEYQSKIKKRSNTTIKGHLIKLEKPDYLAINDEILNKKRTIQYNLELLGNFILRKNQDSNDPTLYSSPIVQFRVRTKEILNRILFRYFVSELRVEDIPQDKQIVLFTLHKQPEASIDVIGRYYEDQFVLISNIWRTLPEDYILLVKEHSNAIGDRSLNFYKKVSALKDVYLIDHKVNSYDLLNRSRAVFTVSGTIAYEAALLSIHSFTFAPTFFNRLNHCTEISWKDFRQYSFFINNIGIEPELNAAEFSEWLLTNSYEGILSDSFSNPECLSEKNIAKLTKAFEQIMS